MTKMIVSIELTDAQIETIREHNDAGIVLSCEEFVKTLDNNKTMIFKAMPARLIINAAKFFPKDTNRPDPKVKTNVRNSFIDNLPEELVEG